MVIKKLYLDPFLDMFNGEIIRYGNSKTPSAMSVLATQKKAIEITSNCTYRRTFHSDRRWAYQMPAYSRELKKNPHLSAMYFNNGSKYDLSVQSHF